VGKHTPGPWVATIQTNPETAGEHFRIDAPEHDGPCPCGGKHPKGKLIAWLSGGGRTWHGHVAPDAHLIAAAPDLLAALKALCSAEAHSPKTGRRELFLAAWRQARAAIGKAEPEGGER
jgi:hypothetical protein